MAEDDPAAAAAPTGGRAPRRWWRQVVEASPDGVMIVEDGTIVYANRVMEDLARVGPGALAGRSVEGLVPPDVRRLHQELRQDYAGDPHPRPMGGDGDLTLCRADGSVLPVDVALAPLSTDGRSLTLATVRDDSARRADQAEIARLAQILQVVPDGVIVVDCGSGTVVDANEAAAAMLGHPTGALQGMPSSQLSAAGDPEFLRGTSPELRVEQLLSKGGETVECEVHAVAVDVAGRTEVVSVVRDVGPRRELERRVRAGEESFRAVFERAPVGLAVTRRDARDARTIVRTNDAFTEMFGYGPHELDGKDTGSLRAARRPRREPVGDGTDEGSIAEATGARRYVRRDGSPLWAEVRSTPLVTDGGGDDLALVHVLDVTERVEAERGRRREGVVTACLADVANAALAHEDVSRVFDLIARGALTAADADAAVLLQPVADPSGNDVAAATGRLAGSLVKHLRAASARAPTTGTRGAADVAPGARGRARTAAPSVGAVLAVPFGPEKSLPSGRLVVCREPGRPPFSLGDTSELARLANLSQVALHLAQARQDQQRLLLIEERQRIARDLHDTVIQDMIAMGMNMNAELATLDDPRYRAHVEQQVEWLGQMVVGLRRAVSQLRDTSGGRSLAREVTDVVAHASRVLPVMPMVTFEGPLELVGPELVDDLVGVLREALSNVARHSGATKAAVSLTVTDRDVLLVVDDDGIGLTGSSQGGFGVLSLTERARRHGGSVSVGPGPVVGTRVTWRCPLP